MGDAQLTDVQSLFPIAGERSYLYSGALAPAAEPVRAALAAWTNAWAHDPIACYDAFEQEALALRDAFARLIGATPAEIGIADNTSRAANLVVTQLVERRGSNVVVDDTTYPSSIYPWLTMTTHKIRVAPTAKSKDPVDAIASAIDGNTVAVTVSHVSPESGMRHDLRALGDAAHSSGALLLVDAAQSTGVIPVNVRADCVDALVTTTMKWMFGLPGVGLAYMGEELLAGAPVDHVGYLGIDLPMGEDWPKTTLPPIVDDARRLELGLPSLSALAPCRAGIELVLEIGVPRIQSSVEKLVSRLHEGLLARGAAVRTPDEPERRAGVVAIEHPDAVGLAAAARNAGVDIGGYEWGVARIDPHVFNKADDVDRFLDVYARFQAGSA